jgi:signal peptidase II
MKPSRTIRWLALLMVLTATAGCDQATKHLARSGLGEAGYASLPGGFVELALAENPGAFLSIGSGLPDQVRNTLFTGLVGLGLAVLLVYLVKTSRLGWFSFLALALVWSGGVSNLFDRLARHGLVTDFIFVRVGPLHTGVFNVADLAIVFGILLLFLSLGFSRDDRQIPPVAAK